MTEGSQFEAGADARAQRIRQVVKDCYRRRAAGEPVSDESVIEAHPDLMPELAKQLAALRLVEAAQRQAETDWPDSVARESTDEEKTSSGLQIRCPHCHTPVEIAADTPFADITCTACGSHFSLIGGETEAYAGDSVATVGHFELIERIGLGGFGTVWKARDMELDRTVAVKIPRRGQLEPAEVEQFLREARTAAQLRHPNIVGIHEVGRDGDTIYIVTDLVRGVPLSDWLTGQRISVREAAELCRKIAEALHHAHEMGVIHRDLKPHNIMIDAEGQPHLMDFGLARREAGEVTLTTDGQILGTPAYMSPEQAQGEAHRAGRGSDVYSLGVILFELLTGELPFRGNARMLIHQVVHEEAPSPRKLNGNVPRDLETVCLKCLQKDPRKRYDSALELADELQRFLRGEAIQARPIGPVARGWRWCKRYPVVSGLAAGLLVTLLAGLSVVSIQWIVVEQQRDIASRNLYHTLVGEGRAIRVARVAGYRGQVWDRLRRALALDTSVRNVDELRQEAVACMGDFVGLQPTVWDDFPSKISRIALRPHGGQLALGLADGTVLLRGLAGGVVTARLPGHQSPIRALAFGPQGVILASGDGKGYVRIWRANASEHWTCTKKFVLQEPDIEEVVITSDGKRLLVCHDSGSKVTSCGIAEEADGPTLVELPLPDEVVDAEGRTFSPDGTLLTTRWVREKRWEIVVWDVAGRQILKVLRPDLGLLYSAVFSRDGRFMVCGGDIGVRAYDTTEYEAVAFVCGDCAHSVAVNPDNELLAFSNWHLGLVRLWSTSANRQVAVLQHPDAMTSTVRVTFSGGGKLLVSASPRSVCLWNLAGGNEGLRPTGHTGGVPGVTFNPDGTLLGSASKDRTVKIWDPATGNLVHELSGFQGLVQTLAFSPDGRMLATGDWARAIQFWDTHSWRELAAVDHPLYQVWSVAFSPNGEYFAIGGEGGVQVWRIEVDGTKGTSGSGLSLREFARPTTDLADTACFSPNSRLLAWNRRHSGKPKTAHVWDLPGAEELFVCPAEIDALTHTIAFCPDSKHLMFVRRDGVIETWNVTTGRRKFAFGGPEYPQMPTARMGGHVALSKDGRLFAAESGRAVTVWDTQSKKLLLTLPEGSGAVWSLAWSPNRDLLAVGTSVGGPVIWNIPKIRAQLAELGLDW